ncbi:MAG: conjugal transfer protein TraH [Pseudomonadota bacterium]
MSTATRLLSSAALALALFVPLSAPGPAEAGMRDQMQGMFDNMINLTPPGYFQTQRRGEISGGNLYVRNRIVDPNIVGLTPPGFRAGCGGIDLFAGSFSFINKEQFIALMKSVAANAVGYAFQLAMEGLCPQCMSVIETLQRKLQELNQHFGDSCQLAQGLVNDTVSAFTNQRVGKASTVGVVQGIGDVFESWSSSTGQSPTEAVASGAPDIMEGRLTGNVVWRALQEHAVDSWFTAGGDDEVLSVIMTIFGTVIVEYVEAEDSFELTAIAGDSTLLESWIEGLAVEYLDCAGEGPNGCCRRRSPSARSCPRPRHTRR